MALGGEVDGGASEEVSLGAGPGANTSFFREAGQQQPRQAGTQPLEPGPRVVVPRQKPCPPPCPASRPTAQPCRAGGVHKEGALGQQRRTPGVWKFGEMCWELEVSLPPDSSWTQTSTRARCWRRCTRTSSGTSRGPGCRQPPPTLTW